MIKNKVLNFSFWRSNFQLLIAIPALIGGIWQICELGNISFSFIRFFSSTQLIADGLLIMSIIFFPVFFIWIVGQMDDLVKNQKSIFKYFSPKPVALGIVIICLAIFNFLIIENIHYTEKQFVEFGRYYLPLVGTFVTYVIFDAKIIYLSKYFSDKILKFIEGVLIILIMISFVLFTKRILVLFHNKFTFPSNVENIQILENKIKEDDSTIRKTKLLYFNNSYLFFELTRKNKTKNIRVIPFEALMKKY